MANTLNIGQKEAYFYPKKPQKPDKTSYFDSFSPLWRKNKRWKKSVSDHIPKVLCDVSAIFVAKLRVRTANLGTIWNAH